MMLEKNYTSVNLSKFSLATNIVDIISLEVKNLRRWIELLAREKNYTSLPVNTLNRISLMTCRVVWRFENQGNLDLQKKKIFKLTNIFFVYAGFVSSRDPTRDGWIKEFIKRKWSSGLFWAGGAAEKKNDQLP